MPSTYTTNGGIELPANGEQSATWGNTVNENMNILDRLTNGVGSITLTGITHTLTTSDGSVSDGHYKVLLLGGSPSGTNTITVSPNDAQHIYIVKNNTGETATFTQGSGSTLNVVAGSTKIIYCDGAGSGAGVVDITGSLDIGALVIDGTALTATGAELNTLDGITATTAELNILDGVTATTAELNILDGVTATTAELNYVDGVTSAIQTQIDTKAPSASPTLTTPTFTSAVTITGGTESWTAVASGTNLTFAYNGTNVMRVDSSGNLSVIGNVNTNGTIS
jgi:hypothetical protein